MKLFARFYPQARRAPAPMACWFDTCTIRMTIDAASITTLRQLAIRVCGEALEFMRIAICAGGTRIQVWLCVRLAFATLLSETIMRELPGAKFRTNPEQPGAAV